MRIIRLLITAALVIFIWITPVFGKVWRGITPLRSTRVEVERLLGAPEPGTQSVYKTTDEVVRVTYAVVECDYGWRVRPHTVVSVIVHPNTPSKFSELKLDERNFEKRRDPNLQNVYYYVNEKEGINYTVDAAADAVTSLEYYPLASDKRLKCVPKRPGVKKPTPKLNRTYP